MKVIMVMFDSLRRDLLSINGGPISCPNFERLANHSVQFNRCYAGSLPCMPARRELHTGRYNFLHRGWGPLEPFDESMPEILKNNGIYTHISTDHYHYEQDGGAGYLGRYSSYETHRGQESDAWQADLSLRGKDCTCMMQGFEYLSEENKKVKKQIAKNNQADREKMAKESDWPIFKTFDNGLNFLKKNGKEDQWFLQIETFDPHEPFFSPDSFQQRYLSPDEFNSPDWPCYTKVHETQSEIERMRRKYYALASLCDCQLGRILDEMDQQNLWNETMLIVNTDHGFFLGEHDWWGKGSMPCFDDLVHLPFFVWDPRCRKEGERRNSLVQTIDIAPTILDFFNLPIPKTMQGASLKETIESDRPIHTYALFGYHGGPVGITDGRYKLLRAVQNKGFLFEYTLMPMHMKNRFSIDEFSGMKLHEPFNFTKGVSVLQIPTISDNRFSKQQEIGGDLLFDLLNDPGEAFSINDPVLKEKMLKEMEVIMKASDAPIELYERYGLCNE